MLMNTIHDVKNNYTVFFQQVADNLTSTRFLYILNCNFFFFKVLGKIQTHACPCYNIKTGSIALMWQYTNILIFKIDDISVVS